MRTALPLVWGLIWALAAPAWAADDTKGLPAGWFVTESAPQLYSSGLDTDGPCEGGRSAWLSSTRDVSTGYGTFMQAFDARAFRGKRLRFSAVVRTENVKGWTGLWMRVEGEDAHQPLAFDNMQSRALQGTTPCKRYDVVLDVAAEARAIMAGLMLSGSGKAWIGAVHIEPVDGSVPTTNLIATRAPPRPSMGRVGWFGFTPERADSSYGHYVRQPDGSWRNAALDDVLTMQGGPAGTTVTGDLNHRPLRVTVHTGGTTRIEGTWGDDPVLIELTGQRLLLEWGIYRRELAYREDFVLKDGSCVLYREHEGFNMGDSTQVCGLALQRDPPVIPLVVAFFANGFRTGF